MNILAIGNKIINESLSLPDELKPTEREIAAMVSFLHKLSSKATPDLAALREAGKKMAQALQAVTHDRPSAHTDNVWENVNTALAEWEAANK